MTKKNLLTSISVVIALILFVVIYSSFIQVGAISAKHGISSVSTKHYTIGKIKSEISVYNNLFKFN